MKYCPQCKRQFTEAWLSFCSDDGTPLIQELTPPQDPNWDPVIRETKTKTKTPSEQETLWLPRQPPAPGGWVAPDERPPLSPGIWQPPPPPRTATPPSQGLALASMITGIVGIVMGGCFGPLPGIAALAMGLVALSQIKNRPDQVTGKSYATAGVIIGGITVAFYVLLLLFFLLSLGLR